MVGPVNAWRIALWIAIVLALLGFLWLVRGVLGPFVLALFIAGLCEPMIRKLRKRGMPRPAAVMVVLLLFFGSIAAIIVASTPYIGHQYNEAKNQIQTLYEKIASTNPDQAISEIDQTLAKNKELLQRLNLPTTREELVAKYIDPNRVQIQRQVQGFLTGGVVSILSVAGQVFMFLLTPIFVFGFLIDLESMRRAAARFIPPSIRKGTLSMLGDIGTVFESYLRGLALTVLFYTAMMGTILGVLGAPYWTVLALVAGLLYLIPVVGGIVSSVVVFTVIALSGVSHSNLISAENSWVFALYCVGAMFVFGLLYDSIVNPRIVGRAVKLNPFVSAFVVFSAAALFGLPGMLCAYPVAGAIKVVLDRLVKFTGSTEGTVKLPAVPLRHRSHAEA